MSIFDSVLIALALAMDCFTISISCGIIQRRMGKQVWAMAFTFGLFQALMPLIGWFSAWIFGNQMSTFDHWISFGLLTFLGSKMIWNGFHNKNDGVSFNPSNPFILFTLAIATSIDALAVGFSFISMGVTMFSDLLLPIFIIGVFSFLLSLLGKFLGVSIGKRLDWPAEQFAGSILILIGLKILYQHLF